MTSSATPSAPDPFVAYLRGVSGGGLRAVVQYDDSGQEVRFERDGGRPPRELVEAFRTERTEWDARGSVYEVGSLHAVIGLYDEGLLVHFPHGDGGTVVALDPSELQELNEFVRGALLRLAEAGAHVDSVPERH